MRRLIAVGTVLVLLVGVAASAFAEPDVPGCSIETYVNLSYPELLCFDGAGFLYVGDGENGFAVPIRRIPPGGGSFQPFGPALWDPDPVGYDRTGKISGIPGSILTGGTITPSYIMAIHPDGGHHYVFGPGGVGFYNPTQMAFDSTGTLFFTDPTQGVYRTAGENPSLIIPRANLPGLPHLFAIDPEDNLFVGTDDGSITKFLPGASSGELVADGFRQSVPIAFGNGGIWGYDLYLIDQNNTDNLIRIRSDGSQEVVGTGFDTPNNGYFMTFGPDHALYVSDALGNKVLRIAETNRPPVADAGRDQELECTGQLTEVELDGMGSSDPDGDDLQYEWAVPAESGAVLDDPTSPTPAGFFPVGPTLVTLTVTDGVCDPVCDDVLITVVDTTPPVVVCTTDKIALWPPNHQMVDMDVYLQASDVCSGPDDLLVSCNVSSSEPDDATGDGEFTGDVDEEDGYETPVPLDLTWDPLLECFAGTVSLRAERDGSEAGRSYSIVCDVLDCTGNINTASCVVVVPHDRRKK